MTRAPSAGFRRGRRRTLALQSASRANPARLCGVRRRSALILPLILAGLSAARADVIPLSELLQGVTVTADECATKKQAVWIEALGRRFCMRVLSFG